MSAANLRREVNKLIDEIRSAQKRGDLKEAERKAARLELLLARLEEADGSA